MLSSISLAQRSASETLQRLRPDARVASSISKESSFVGSRRPTNVSLRGLTRPSPIGLKYTGGTREMTCGLAC